MVCMAACASPASARPAWYGQPCEWVAAPHLHPLGEHGVLRVAALAQLGEVRADLGQLLALMTNLSKEVSKEGRRQVRRWVGGDGRKGLSRKTEKRALIMDTASLC